MISFHLSCGGLGDTVSGLYAACGAADAGNEVIYMARHPKWLERAGFSHPGVEVLPYAMTKCDANLDYNKQLAEGAIVDDMPEGNRPLRYCRNIARTLRVPEFTPSLPKQIRTSDEKPQYVVLSPFSAHKPREWPHWRMCAARLAANGIRVLALADGSQRARLESLFVGLDVQLMCGLDEELVIRLLLSASVVVGNDSGIPHVAGLLRRKVIVIASHLNPQFVFRPAQIISIGPPKSFACRYCGWQPRNGYVARCNAVCDALTAISSDVVVKVIMEEVDRASKNE